MTDELLVVGAGGHGRVVVSTLLAAGYGVAAVLDDDEAKWGGDLMGVPVRGVPSGADLEMKSGVLALGDNALRRRVAARLPMQWLSVAHPRACCAEGVQLGAGTVVMAGAILQAGAHIGRHAIINSGAIVEHDCMVGDYAHVAPGAVLAGSVSVGEGALLGVNCSVVPGVSIGAWAVVGAGSVVLHDVPAQAVVCGVPARALRQASA